MDVVGEALWEREVMVCQKNNGLLVVWES
jgi:hypothetical protein